MACAVRPTNVGNGLAKMDVQTGEVKTWHEPGAVTGGSVWVYCIGPSHHCTMHGQRTRMQPTVLYSGQQPLLLADNECLSAAYYARRH